MKVATRSGTNERSIITAMIVSRQALARIVPKWSAEMFDAEWTNIVGQWCVNHFKKYDDAPGRNIEGIFEEWAGTSKDKDTIKLVEKYLGGLSGEYKIRRKEVNPDMVLDQAQALFNKVRLRRLGERIGELIEDGKVEQAEKLRADYSPIEMATGAGVDLFLDKERLRQAFERRYESIVTYNQSAMDRFFGTRLRRGAFIAFEGKEKVGKSLWLIDMAYRGMLDRKRVAFFEVGDMTEEDMFMRFAARASKKPIEACDYRYPRSLRINDNEPEIEWKEKKASKNMTFDFAWEAFQNVQMRGIKSKKSYMKLVTVPAGTMSVLGIKSTLDGWLREEGYAPDIVVVDYADLLAPVDGKMETRDQINFTWLNLRSLSQIYHALTVTATQADAKAYEAETLTRANFANDKRKMAHVNAMVGINQTDTEQEDQVQRLNLIVNREGRYSEKACCTVVGCLEIGNPVIQSYFGKF